MFPPATAQKIYRRDSMRTYAGIFAITKPQTGQHSGTGSLCRVVHQSLKLQERRFGEALTRFVFAAGSPRAVAFSSDLDTKMEAATGCGLLFFGILCLLCTHSTPRQSQCLCPACTAHASSELCRRRTAGRSSRPVADRRRRGGTMPWSGPRPPTASTSLVARPREARSPKVKPNGALRA